MKFWRNNRVDAEFDLPIDLVLAAERRQAPAAVEAGRP